MYFCSDWGRCIVENEVIGRRVSTSHALSLSAWYLAVLLGRFGGHGLGGLRNPYPNLIVAEATHGQWT